MELTREETIKAFEACKSEDCANCPLYEYESCVELREINVLRYLKEKEPAPYATGTSPEVKTLHIDDTTKSAICQALEFLKDAINSILSIHDNEMSEEEQRAFDIGITYIDMLNAKKEMEKLNGGDGNAST